MTDISAQLAEFDTTIAKVKTADEAYTALQHLTETTVGVKLFTVMTVDMVAEVSRRAFTSDPENYPASGTKPLHYDEWFDSVHKARKPFVANTLADISKVFFDYELIGSLGCGSVINLPIVIGDELVGTVNILHEEHYYTPERVALNNQLALPAKTAYLIATRA